MKEQIVITVERSTTKDSNGTDLHIYADVHLTKVHFGLCGAILTTVCDVLNLSQRDRVVLFSGILSGAFRAVGSESIGVVMPRREAGT